MSVSSEKRVQNIDEFTGLLLEEGDTHTAIFESSKVNLEIKKKKPKNRRVRVADSGDACDHAHFVGADVLGAICIGNFATEGEPSRPSQTMDSSIWTISRPKWIPLYRQTAYRILLEKILMSLKNDPAYADRFEFIEKEDYNEEYSKNIVYDQEPAQGTPMPNKGYVTLYVSKGSEMVSMPGLTGSTLEFATKTLTENELKYEVVYIVDASAESGLIIRTYPTEGEMVSKKTSTIYLEIKEEGTVSSSSSCRAASAEARWA